MATYVWEGKLGITFLARIVKTSSYSIVLVFLAVMLLLPIHVHSMEGGSDRNVSPVKPNAIERAIECEIDKANKIAEEKKN